MLTIYVKGYVRRKEESVSDKNGLYVGGNATNTTPANVGPFYFNANNDASNTNSNIGCGLSPYNHIYIHIVLALYKCLACSSALAENYPMKTWASSLYERS